MESNEEIPSSDFSAFMPQNVRKCNCTFVQKSVGDGCETCNPALALSFCKEQNATLIDQNRKLRSDLEYAVDCLQKTSEPALIAIASRMSQTIKDTADGK